jgi:hypothetical protein
LGVAFFSFLSWHHSLEFCKNSFQRLSDNVCKEVKSTSVGHANNDFLSSLCLKFVNKSLHARNEGFNSLETESLHGVELGGDKLSELVCPKNTIE